ALGVVRKNRLAIEGDDGHGVSLELQRVDAGQRGVDEAQANALAAAYREAVDLASVDGRERAEPALAAAIGLASEIGDLDPLAVEAPVLQHPDEVAIDL